MKLYKLTKGFIIQKLGKKTAIFDGEESVLYTLNETASFMFQKIKLGWKMEKIVKAIVKKYSIKGGESLNIFLNRCFSSVLAKRLLFEV